MRNLLKSRAWLNASGSTWDSQPPCALPACSNTRTLWHRVWRRSGGGVLQGSFYCSPQCFESALTACLTQLSAMRRAPLAPHRIPLGLLMVARGRLTYIEVAAALEAQRRAQRGTIGEWLEKLGLASERDVNSALGLQWGCPVASSLEPAVLPLSCRIPLPILDSLRMLPLQYAASTQTLSVACGRRVDHAALYAIEQIIGCRTQPCVGGSNRIASRLERMRQSVRSDEVEFGPMRDSSDIVRIALSYITKLAADDIRAARVGPFVWLRLQHGISFMDVTFEIRPELERAHAPQASMIPAAIARAATTSA